MRTVTVNASRSYEIKIGPGLLSSLGAFIRHFRHVRRYRVRGYRGKCGKGAVKRGVEKTFRSGTKNHVFAFWIGGWRGNDTKGRGGVTRNFAKLYFPFGKENYFEVKKGNRQDGMREQYNDESVNDSALYS